MESSADLRWVSPFKMHKRVVERLKAMGGVSCWVTPLICPVRLAAKA